MRLIKKRLRNCYGSVKQLVCYCCVKAALSPCKYIYGAGELESYKMRAGKDELGSELEKIELKAS